MSERGNEPTKHASDDDRTRRSSERHGADGSRSERGKGGGGGEDMMHPPTPSQAEGERSPEDDQA